MSLSCLVYLKEICDVRETAGTVGTRAAAWEVGSTWQQPMPRDGLNARHLDAALSVAC